MTTERTQVVNVDAHKGDSLCDHETVGAAPVPSQNACGMAVSLIHLDRLTDSTGLIQHAIYMVPRRDSGYTIDDNARALLLCTRMWCKDPSDRMLGRIIHYLSLLEFARRPGGGFHNLLSYQRHWLDTDSDGDCQGQAVRALAEVLGSSLPHELRMLARELIVGALPVLENLRSLRAQAYVIMAWAHLRTSGLRELEAMESIAWSAAQHLVDCHHRSKRAEWDWFESRMTYANAVLPHALFDAARLWPNESFLEIARGTFAFLDRETTVDGLYWPVGNKGWYSHGEEKALYDQQPVEAATMADAAYCSFKHLGEACGLETFRRARDWFHGENSLQLSMADLSNGACYDGLQSTGVNRNQGAESTLAFLLTEVHFTEYQASLSKLKPPESAGV